MITESWQLTDMFVSKVKKKTKTRTLCFFPTVFLNQILFRPFSRVRQKRAWRLFQPMGVSYWKQLSCLKPALTPIVRSNDSWIHRVHCIGSNMASKHGRDQRHNEYFPCCGQGYVMLSFYEDLSKVCHCPLKWL